MFTLLVQASKPNLLRRHGTEWMGINTFFKSNIFDTSLALKVHETSTCCLVACKIAIFLPWLAVPKHHQSKGQCPHHRCHDANWCCWTQRRWCGAGRRGLILQAIWPWGATWLEHAWAWTGTWRHGEDLLAKSVKISVKIQRCQDTNTCKTSILSEYMNMNEIRSYV